MNWPNHSNWSSGKHEITVQTNDGPRFLWSVKCGILTLVSGKLVACDPFAFMSAGNNPHVLVPPGKYPVSVTLADVSEGQDRTHVREAYATVTISEGAETHRKVLPLARAGKERPELPGGEFIGFGVDAGTACFVDDESTATCMPERATWLKDLFENERPDSWFNLMDDPAHIRDGLANIELPLAQNDENIIIIHSGWGDGTYPVVGSFDASGRLLAVHIDFFVVRDA
jgi:hypothetical protein